MPSKKRTTVVLTDPAWAVMNRWEVFGLKEILSAGLMLFDELPVEVKVALLRRVIHDGQKSRPA